MTYKKKPLHKQPSILYPSGKTAASNRREFLTAIGKLSVVGAAGMLLSACDHVGGLDGESPEKIKPEDSDSGYVAGGDVPPDTDSAMDTGYLAGDVAPPDSDSGIDTEVVDSDTGYIAGGDVPPDSDTAYDTGVDSDTGYLGGDIAPDTETAMDTGYLAGVDMPPDSDTVIELDTGYMAGGLQAPLDTASDIDSDIPQKK